MKQHQQGVASVLWQPHEGTAAIIAYWQKCFLLRVVTFVYFDLSYADVVNEPVSCQCPCACRCCRARAGACAGNGAVAGKRRRLYHNHTFVFVPLLAAAPTPTKQRRNHRGCARAFASAALPAKAQTQETRRELPSYTMRASDQKAMLPTHG